jgi:hypothetical protein
VKELSEKKTKKRDKIEKRGSVQLARTDEFVTKWILKGYEGYVIFSPSISYTTIAFLNVRKHLVVTKHKLQKHRQHSVAWGFC